MRIKVCQVIPTLVQGGAEKQMSLLARNLNPDKFESHVVVLTHSGPHEQQLRDEGVNVHLIGKRGKLDLTALFRLIRKLREIKPDVVHTWLFAANSYGRLAARRAGVPVIIAGERCVDPWKTWWHHAIDNRLLYCTDAIITNTDAVTEFYAQHGIPESRFTVIPNAVEQTRTSRLSHGEFFERLGLKPSRFIVGAVGRLWQQKGYEDLVWAGEMLRTAHEDVTLVIIGDGPERDKLLKLRDKGAMYRSIRFVGHRSDASELMSAMNVLWNGSAYEGQSNTILEAMALGIPVVASEIPGNRDLVQHGKTGYLFTLGDVNALARQTFALLNDDDKRSEMGRNAQLHIETEFSLNKMVASHEAIYVRLFESKRGT